MGFTKQVLFGIVAMSCLTILYCEKGSNPTSSLSPVVAWETWEMTGYGNIYNGTATMVVSKARDGTIRIDSLSFSNPPAIMSVTTKSIEWQKPHAVITATGTIVRGSNSTTYTFVAKGDFGAALTSSGTYSLDFPVTGPVDDEGDWSRVRISGDGVFSESLPVSVIGVSLKPWTVIRIGKFEQLTATIIPSTALNKSVIWASSDIAVASVSSTGFLTGQAKGTTVVSAKTVDGNHVAQCVVTVVNNTAENGTVTDIDANIYLTVKIGNQEWTVENLMVTKYNDGTAIPLITKNAIWDSCYHTSKGAYCYFNNTTNSDSIKRFGALYNWYAVNTKKLAPAGWHVPSDSEWTILEKYLVKNGYNWDKTTDTSAHNKIAKALAAKADWTLEKLTNVVTDGAINKDLEKNNSSGFSAIPAGYRNGDGDFFNGGYSAYWWSSTTAHDTLYAYFRDLFSEYDDLSRSYYINDDDFKICGFSVRLIKD